MKPFADLNSWEVKELEFESSPVCLQSKSPFHDNMLPHEDDHVIINIIITVMVMIIIIITLAPYMFRKMKGRDRKGRPLRAHSAPPGQAWVAKLRTPTVPVGPAPTHGLTQSSLPACLPAQSARSPSASLAPSFASERLCFSEKSSSERILARLTGGFCQVL